MPTQEQLKFTVVEMQDKEFWPKMVEPFTSIENGWIVIWFETCRFKFRPWKEEV